MFRRLPRERPLGGAAELSPRSKEEHGGVVWGRNLRETGRVEPGVQLCATGISEEAEREGGGAGDRRAAQGGAGRGRACGRGGAKSRE